MKSIIVKRENSERIMSEFAKAQGKATERIIKTYERLEDIICDIDKRLAGIPKKALEGVEVEYHFAQKFSRRYAYYIPISTHFTLHYSKGLRRIVNIGRFGCPNRINGGYPYNIYLTDEAKQAVIKLFS